MSVKTTKPNLIYELLFKLESNGVVTNTFSEYKSNLERYLQLEILLSWLRDEALLPSSNDRDTKEWRRFRNNLMHAELSICNLPHYLPNIPPESNTVAESTKSDLLWLQDKILHHAQAIEVKFLNVIDMHGALGPSRSISMLPTIVSDKQSTCSHLQKELDLKRKKNSDLNRRLRDIMLDNLAKMEKYITKQILVIQPDANKMNTKRLVLKADALVLKLKCRQMEIMCGTYTSKTIAALKTLREYLSEEKKQMKEEIESKKSLVGTYEKLGPSFKQIVAEFNQIQKEIRDKQWNLDKFGTYEKN